jgi:hypothetical protein
VTDFDVATERPPRARTDRRRRLWLVLVLALLAIVIAA